MPTRNRVKQPDFMEESQVREALFMMLSDNSLKTEAGYTADEEMYPNHQAPFVEKHMSYLKNHPKVNPKDYLSNLKIMIKIRS